jgi:hypothetical protein
MMRHFRVSAMLGTFVLAGQPLLLCLPETAQSANGEAMTPIMVAVSKIRDEPSTATRTAIAQQLSELISREGQSMTISQGDIGSLASLMSDRDDSVRFWVASSLGYIGPRAQLAVPALRQALKEIKDAKLALTSAGAIEMALAKIAAYDASVHLNTLSGPELR